MKKLDMMALFVGAALLTGFGVTSASADMKCGAGKCGASKAMNGTMGSMSFEERKMRCAGQLQNITDCVDKASNSKEMQVCRAQVVEMAKKIESFQGNTTGKCGTGKCGAAPKAPVMKCGGK